MSYTEYRNGQSAQTVQAGGGYDWVNPNNALSPVYPNTDDVFTTCSFTKVGYGDILRISGWNWADVIPASADISFVGIRRRHKANVASKIKEAVVQCRDSSGYIGQNRALTSALPTTTTWWTSYEYDATAAQLRDSNFAIDYQVQSYVDSSGSYVASLDAISVIVRFSTTRRYNGSSWQYCETWVCTNDSPATWKAAINIKRWNGSSWEVIG